MSNIVAIVGRPNVGKSTLFNRLTGSRHAIVDEISGVTRDRIYGKSFWNGKNFSVIDTGGYAINSDDNFEKAIQEQVIIAIEEADVLLFVVDVTTGVTDYDEVVADIIRRSGKKAYVVVNKVDNHSMEAEAAYFYSLGIPDVYSISSMSGSGTGDLLDALSNDFYDDKDDGLENEDIPKIAIVGRPNAGKSSMANVLIGEERNIVTPIAGTTRDSIHTRYNKFGFEFLLIDTAGIRRKNRVSEDLEFYSVMRAIRSIEESDVSILMVDATRGFEGQDQKIFNLIQRNGKGVVVVINKWDLVEKDHTTMKKFEEDIREKTAPFVDYPIIFTSVISKQRVFKTIEEAHRVYDNRSRKISTSKLNDYMLPLIEAYSPPAIKGKFVKIKFITQLPTAVPSFAFFCNLPQYIRTPYKRFLENKLRQKWDFSGVPINIFMRKK